MKQTILKTLKQNLQYQEGEKVAIIYQEWSDTFDNSLKQNFDNSKKISKEIYQVFKENNIDVELFSYIPTEARSGVDAPEEIYEKAKDKDIIFMPTVFSLTHTDFTKKQRKRGARLASMPKFALEWFEKDGPMDVNMEKIIASTKEYSDKMRNSSSVTITAPETEITIEINNNLVHESNGIIPKGDCGNLPGAEAFCVPKNANGHFTIFKGWGGPFPLEENVKFIVKDCKIIELVGKTEQANKYIEEKVKPLIFKEKKFNVLAEFGVGTNPNVTKESLKRYGWSGLLAEKIFGTVHFANGNSAGMGGDNNVPVHLDWVIENAEMEWD
jgi:leucyl aminopeptidase (aminopeptidase T)